MSSANDRQVGGTHYASEYQHWDFVADAKLGYFEGQISKYGTRHRSKAGRQDVEKAIHFTSKLMELALHVRYQPHHGIVTDALVRCYAQANRLDALETELMRKVCGWRTPGDLGAVRHLLGSMLETHYGDPGSGYVNQDRCPHCGTDGQHLCPAASPAKGPQRL